MIWYLELSVDPTQVVHPRIEVNNTLVLLIERKVICETHNLVWCH